MKKSSLTSFLSVAGVASLAMLSVNHAFAQTTVATDPVGYTTTALQANSDTLVSIPFTRPAAYTGAIASISGNTITLSGTPGFTANQYVYNTTTGTQSNTYYAIVGPLLTSLTNTVGVTSGGTTVTGSGFTASGIAVGDEIIISGLAYNVAAVTDTALTLSRGYTGATASGLSASFDHSPKEGSYYTVTANGTGSLTVSLNGDSLSMVAAGTSVSLIPYWTLGTAFPASDAGKSFIVSTGTGPRNYQTQILLPDLVSPGINLSTSGAFINYSSHWVAAGTDGSVSSDDTILQPTANFTVRNAATATTFTPAGGVYMNRVTAVLDTQTSSAQDNAVSLPRPVDVSLNDLGLVTKDGSGNATSNSFVISGGVAPRSIKDTILLYDNANTGVNKSSPGYYYYYNGGWRLGGSDGTVDYGDTVKISSGTGFIIRKVATTNGASSFAQNTRSY